MTSKNEGTIWITGAGGLIGHCLVQNSGEGAPASLTVGLTRAELDLLDFAAVQQRFKQEQPSLIIHCAAISKSPACQAQPELARKLNVEATRALAELAADATFVFFSTDLVF